jgi:hypothetical protein
VITAPRLEERALGILRIARDSGVSLRLIGGMAIWTRTAAPIRERFDRQYGDLDFVGRRAQSKLISRMMEQNGFAPEKRFNAVHGERRLIFYAEDEGFQVDVFLDRLEMSHTLDFRVRLEAEPTTVPAAELLLSKLQIARPDRKDFVDAAMLLAGHRLSTLDSGSTINIERVAMLCSGDWGLFTTASDNIEMARKLLPEITVDPQLISDVTSKMETVENAIGTAPKTRAWKLRARVGRRVRWFEVPDEVRQ